MGGQRRHMLLLDAARVAARPGDPRCPTLAYSRGPDALPGAAPARPRADAAARHDAAARVPRRAAALHGRTAPPRIPDDASAPGCAACPPAGRAALPCWIVHWQLAPSRCAGLLATMAGAARTAHFPACAPHPCAPSSCLCRHGHAAIHGAPRLPWRAAAAVHGHGRSAAARLWRGPAAAAVHAAAARCACRRGRSGGCGMGQGCAGVPYADLHPLTDLSSPVPPLSQACRRRAARRRASKEGGRRRTRRDPSSASPLFDCCRYPLPRSALLRPCCLSWLFSTLAPAPHVTHSPRGGIGKRRRLFLARTTWDSRPTELAGRVPQAYRLSDPTSLAELPGLAAAAEGPCQAVPSHPSFLPGKPIPAHTRQRERDVWVCWPRLCWRRRRRPGQDDAKYFRSISDRFLEA